MASDNVTKNLVNRLILDVMEASQSFCMDVKEEREALADVLTVDLLGRFKIKPKPVEEATSSLATIRTEKEVR